MVKTIQSIALHEPAFFVFLELMKQFVFEWNVSTTIECMKYGVDIHGPHGLNWPNFVVP